MDLPAAESERVAQPRRRRRVAMGVMVAFVVLGVVGVTAAALIGHDPSRVVAVSTGAHQAAQPTVRKSTTTTTAPTTTAPTTTTTPVSTTGVTAATTVPSAPAPTVATNPPATSPPTNVLPGRLQITQSTANFPSTPAPYSPMPIVSITITNTGGVAVSSVVVHPVGVYSVPSSNCSTLAPGQSCVAQVQFCPTAPNHYLDTLTVTGQDTRTGLPLQATITLDGTAT